MRKTIFIGLFVIVFVIGLAYADDIEKQRSDLKELGVDVVGNSFSYDKNSNTLTISQGSSAIIPSNFNGNIQINGGKVKLANNAEFTGMGSYSNIKGFSIQNGNLNGLNIMNGYSVNFKGFYVTGTAGPECSPECRVAGQIIGKDTKFVYDLEQKKMIIIGNPDTSTIPNGDIKKKGSKYYLGDTELDIVNSIIYIRKGDKVKFDGITFLAKEKNVLLYFEQNGDFLRPRVHLYSSLESPVLVRNGAKKEVKPQIRIDDAIKQSGEAWADRNFNGIQKNLNQRITDTGGSKLAISDIIEDTAFHYNVDSSTLGGLISAESSGNPEAKFGSSFGLGQMTKIAVKELQRIDQKGNWDWEKVRTDPAENIRASAAYFTYLQKLFDGNEEKAVVAYKIGPTAARKIFDSKGTSSLSKNSQVHLSRVLASKKRFSQR